MHDLTPHAQAVVSGIAIGGVVTSSLSFFAQLSGEAAPGTPTPEDVAPAAFKWVMAARAKGRAEGSEDGGRDSQPARHRRNDMLSRINHATSSASHGSTN